MRTVYIDSDYRCYTENAEGLEAVETPFFDGMCNAAVECYRYVPTERTWIRDDGEVFEGEMITLHTPYSVFQAIQSAYAQSLAQLQDMEAALRLLEVEPVEEVEGNG